MIKEICFGNTFIPLDGSSFTQMFIDIAFVEWIHFKEKGKTDLFSLWRFFAHSELEAVSMSTTPESKLTDQEML